LIEAPPPQPTTPVLSDSRRTATEAVTWPVRVAAAWIWRILVIVAGIYLAVKALSTVWLVVFSLVIALLFCAVLHPLESRLNRVMRGPRSLPTACTLLIGLAALGLVGWFVTWQISSHASELADQLTNFVNRTKDWLQTGPLHLHQADFDKLSSNITDAIKSHQGQLISGAVQTLRTLGEVVAGALLILLSTFFFLRDGELIWRWVCSLAPAAARQRIDHAGRLGWRALGGYMRGVVLIALFHAVTVTILLFVLHVPLAAALGVVIFLGSFVPLVGITVAGALCVAVTLLEHGVPAAITVTIAIIILFQLEGHLLQPLIMSRAVEIHPLAIAVTVLSASAVAGIPGALIGVPLIAFLNTVVRALRVPLDEEPVGSSVPSEDSQPAPPAGAAERGVPS
jgi:putative heme transporter